MTSNPVAKDRQVEIIDEFLAANRLEKAADYLVELAGAWNIRHKSLTEEGHVSRILNAILGKEPSLGIETAVRVLKAMPVRGRDETLSTLLDWAEANADKNRPLASRALLVAAKYSSEAPELRERAVQQYLAAASRLKEVDAGLAFEAASHALAFSQKDETLRQSVETGLRPLNIPGLNI
jgi:hypothetical protein